LEADDDFQGPVVGMDKPDVTSPGESIRGPKEKNSPSVRKCHPGEYIKKRCLGRVFLVVKHRFIGSGWRFSLLDRRGTSARQGY